jgi:hypothetical protein
VLELTDDTKPDIVNTECEDSEVAYVESDDEMLDESNESNEIKPNEMEQESSNLSRPIDVRFNRLLIN